MSIDCRERGAFLRPELIHLFSYNFGHFDFGKTHKKKTYYYNNIYYYNNKIIIYRISKV